MRRRVWCEHVEPRDLEHPFTARLLARFGVEPVEALSPEAETAGLARALRPLAEADLGLTLAPLGPGREGFSSVEGALAARRVEAALAFATEHRLDVKGVVVRLGRGWSTGRGLRRRLPAALVSGWNTGRARHDREVAESERVFAGLVAELRSRGLEASAEAEPLSLLDLGRTRRTSALLDVAGLEAGWDRVAGRVVSAKLGLGGLPAQGVIAALAGFLQKALGERAALTIGAVGAGPEGDGPKLPTPRALERDVAVARAEGVDDLWLDGLDGVLRRGRPEAWLDALVGAERRRSAGLVRWPAELALRSFR